MKEHKKSPDWDLATQAWGMGHEFKSLETAVQECIWAEHNWSQKILTAIANEENQ